MADLTLKMLKISELDRRKTSAREQGVRLSFAIEAHRLGWIFAEVDPQRERQACFLLLQAPTKYTRSC